MYMCNRPFRNCSHIKWNSNSLSTSHVGIKNPAIPKYISEEPLYWNSDILIRLTMIFDDVSIVLNTWGQVHKYKFLSARSLQRKILEGQK